MNKMYKKLNKMIIGTMLFILLSVSIAYAVPVVEVYFDPVVQTAERNSHFTTSIKVSSNETIQIDGVDANFFYDADVFKDPVLSSSIGSWMITLEDVSVPGKVSYQKGSDGTTEFYSVTAGVPKVIYTIEFKVSSDAALATENFVFQNGFTNITAQGYDGSLVVTFNTGQVRVTEDKTAPITTASKPGDLYNSVQNISLAAHASDRSGDLKEIRYTLNNAPGVSPNMSSDIYETPLNIPANTTQYLMFFGVDHYGNIEDINLEVYTIDTAPPVAEDLYVSPNFCRAGATIYVSFNVNELLQGGEPVSVKIGSDTMSVIYNTYPTYVYSHDVIGDETEGTNNVVITMIDLASNQGIDSSEEVAYDFTPPTYSEPRISALSPIEAVLEFEASELLDVSNTVITISGNAWTYDSNDGTTYYYLYTKGGAETSQLIEVHGYDLAGNDSWNTEGWNIVTVSGKDRFNNQGEDSVTININYGRKP
ncbi:chitobiase/beta-hexosaminidase C-terminal domain-containing protein [Candidatus Margulisiibacteriota bacterium]